MKPGDLVRIGQPSDVEEHWGQIGIIFETNGFGPYQTKVLLPGGFSWFAGDEFTLVNDGDDCYDSEKETE
jgi:hypothetical protein